MNNYAALTILGCWSNGITTLNVSKCTAIYNLEYESNQIAELNVSGGKFLMGLICNGNGLNGIDLIGCPDNIAIAYNGELPQVSKPTIFTENIPDATRRAPYSFMLTGLGGTTTRKWTMTRGLLSDGLKISTKTGEITVKAGMPVTFILGAEISGAAVYVDDVPAKSIEISDDGTFILPAEFVREDFKVCVKSSDGATESEELYITAE